MKQIERVLNLASMGYRLFPLSPMSKIPLGGTNGVLDATNEEAKLLSWDAEKENLNWGIAGGRIEGNDESYLIVIDVDTKEGKNGANELVEIEQKYGAVPDTLKVRTASGGYHFYFLTRVKRDRYRKTFKGTKHIDIKSSGGYLVLWGCRNTDGHYTVESGHINNLLYLEDWLGEDTEGCITGTSKDYERSGVIGHGDGRWAYITSWAGYLRSKGLKGEALFQALWDKKQLMESPPDDRMDENFIRKLALTYSGYKDSFQPTDQGNADRFVAAYGPEVKHSHQMGWFYWNEKQWARDPGEKAVMELAGQLINVVNNEIGLAEDKKHIKVLDKTKQMLSMHFSRKNALSLAKISKAIDVDADDFDKQPFLFNVNNGIIDLTTGDLKPHTPEAMLSKISPIDYDMDKECPKFERFIDEITCGDKELAKWLQCYLGYGMTASVKEQLFAVFYGTGGNGKTVLVNVVNAIMGQYTLETPVETITHNRNNTKSGPSNDVARIKGARLVTCRESEQGTSLAESLIKSLTGGDKMSARFLHKEFFEFRPVAKWILFTNHKPSIRGTDKGIWRRVKLVPFSYAVPEEKKNKNLEPELLGEASGILNWLVEGCMMWQKNGFPKCAAIDDATDDYRQDEDRLSEFIEDVINPGPNLKTSASDLYKAYRWYATDSGDYILNNKRFVKEMTDREYVRKRLKEGNFWMGIGLTTEYANKVFNYSESAVGF